MVLLSLLGVTLLTVAATEHSVAFNALWSEGSLSAAEAGVHRGLNQLSANAQNSMQVIANTAIANTYNYRSGRKTDTTPQPLQFVGSRVEEGYSIAVGTGYNPSGYAFHTYQINATGSGPRNARREIEVRAEYGPVAQ
jgi:Tfp pilus assembly protein PilX